MNVRCAFCLILDLCSLIEERSAILSKDVTMQLYMTVWASDMIPLHMGKTETADSFWLRFVGNNLAPPSGSDDYIQSLGPLIPKQVRSLRSAHTKLCSSVLETIRKPSGSCPEAPSRSHPETICKDFDVILSKICQNLFVVLLKICMCVAINSCTAYAYGNRARYLIGMLTSELVDVLVRPLEQSCVLAIGRRLFTIEASN